MAIPRADVLTGITGSVQATIAICIIALLIALFTGYAVLKSFSRGLDQLVKAADNLSQEQWDQPLPHGHSVELDGLAGSFEAMARRLRGSVETVAKQNLALEESNRTLEARVIDRSLQVAKISNLVEQTDDGFLVTDATGIITYVNPAPACTAPACTRAPRRALRPPAGPPTVRSSAALPDQSARRAPACPGTGPAMPRHRPPPAPRNSRAAHRSRVICSRVPTRRR